jgi:hypothetical protein
MLLTSLFATLRLVTMRPKLTVGLKVLKANAVSGWNGREIEVMRTMNYGSIIVSRSGI